MSCGAISSIWRSRYGRHASDLGGLGRAVVGRPALQHVGDVDVALARQSQRREHVVEQPAGLPHERLAARILFGAGRLADEQPVGVRDRRRRAPLRLRVRHSPHAVHASTSAREARQCDSPAMRARRAAASGCLRCASNAVAEHAAVGAPPRANSSAWRALSPQRGASFSSCRISSRVAIVSASFAAATARGASPAHPRAVVVAVDG